MAIVVDDVKKGVDESIARLQNLAKGLDRSLAALALLSASQFKECPNLVWVAPILVEKKYLRNPRKWCTQRYSVVFICAHSGEAGHEPFEIEMPRGWIAKIAPWLELCRKLLTRPREGWRYLRIPCVQVRRLVCNVLRITTSSALGLVEALPLEQ